jgi:hypothetical protein
MQMQNFDQSGRRVASSEMRTFGENPSDYYRLEQPAIDYLAILDRIGSHLETTLDINADQFERRVESLLSNLKSSPSLSNLAGGVYVPFAYRRVQRNADLGKELQDHLLPGLQRSFSECFPEARFKAVLQGDSELAKSINLDPHSRYQKFVDAIQERTVVGIYFPQALQEFDLSSQRRQMASLPELVGGSICLSGGIDMCVALTGTPKLLFSNNFYTPILTMAAYVHSDERLVLLLKAYGPHMEFWCMTQMLTPSIRQVSEQWAGGLTVFDTSPG